MRHSAAATLIDSHSLTTVCLYLLTGPAGCSSVPTALPFSHLPSCICLTPLLSISQQCSIKLGWIRENSCDITFFKAIYFSGHVVVKNISLLNVSPVQHMNEKKDEWFSFNLESSSSTLFVEERDTNKVIIISLNDLIAANKTCLERLIAHKAHKQSPPGPPSPHCYPPE